MPATKAEIGNHNIDDRLSALVDGAMSEEDVKATMVQLRDEAHGEWSARHAFRAARADARDLFRGRHWEGKVKNQETGATQTEKEYLESKGRVPLAMNLIANIISNIDGQFRQNQSGRLAFAVEGADEESVQMMNLARRAVRRYNQSPVIEADGFKEHILSGASGFKSTVAWDQRLQRYEVKDADVDQTRLFFNLDIRDRRFDGLRLIGEIHDASVAEVVSKFARDRKEADRIIEMYRTEGSDTYANTPSRDFDMVDAMSFLAPTDAQSVRVVECWRPVYRWVRYGFDPLFEYVQDADGYGLVALPDNKISRIQNERRRAFAAGAYDSLGLTAPPLLELDETRYDPFWHFFFMSPDGDLLRHGPTPYAHAEHPYSPGLALLMDGETWGVTENLADPQKWMNRILIHLDQQLSSGGQGMLGVDKDILESSGLSPAKLAEEYGKPNSVIAVSKGNLPWDSVLRQFDGRGLQPGWLELVPMLTDFMQRVSGISGAAQGFDAKSGTPAALYQQQIVQANLNVLGYIQTYFEVLRRKDRKEIGLITQAFQERRRFKGEMDQEVEYDPDAVSNMDWDVAMGDVTDTAVYRQLWEGDLKEMLMNGFFGPPGPQSLSVYLQASANPRADLLKQIISDAMVGQANGMDPGAAAMADPAAMAALAQSLPAQ